MNHIRPIIISTFALLLFTTFSVSAAWTPAPANPPNNNAAEPINVSATAQSKAGPFLISSPSTQGSLSVIGVSWFWGKPLQTVETVVANFLGKVRIGGGNPQLNKVLASEDENGNATWKSLSELCVGGACGGDSLWIKEETGVLSPKETGIVVEVPTKFRAGDVESVNSKISHIGSLGIGYDVADKATNAGVLKYDNTGNHSLNIYGGGKTVGSRLVNIYDNLNVYGTINRCTGTGACSPVEGGSGLPNAGQPFGQTLYWDTTVWKPSTNLINDTTLSTVAANNLLTPGQMMFAYNYNATGQMGYIRASGTGLDIHGVNTVGSTRVVSVDNALKVNGVTQTDNLIIPTGAGIGKVLVSNEIGSASWVATSSLGITPLPSAVINNTLRYDGAKWVPGTNLLNNGTNVGVGISPDATARLSVSGKLKIIDGTQGPGKIFVSDSLGVGSWVATSTVFGPESEDFNWQRINYSGRDIIINRNPDNVIIGGADKNVGPASYPNGATSKVTIRRDVSENIGADLVLLQTKSTTQAGNSATLSFAESMTADNGYWSIGKKTSGNDASVANNFFIGVKDSSDPGVIRSIFNITTGGRVGIGTQTPAANLDVIGSANFSGGVIASGVASLGNILIDNGGVDGARMIWKGGIGGDQEFRARVDQNGELEFFNQEGAANPTLRLTQDGKVIADNLDSVFVNASKATLNNLQIKGATTNPGQNKVLVSADNLGNTTWKTLTEIGVVNNALPAGQSDQTLRYNNGSWVGNDNLKIADNGVVTTSDDLQVLGSSLVVGNQGIFGGLAIGILGAPTAKLDVNGQVRIRGGSPGDNKILVSDANGLASWKNASAIPGVTTDVDTDDQTLSINGNRLSISEGNSVDLPVQKNYTASGGLYLAINSSNGDGIFGISTSGVTTNAIANSAVTEDKLGALSVSQTKIQDNAILSRSIANGAVTSIKISAGTAGAGKILLSNADGSVGWQDRTQTVYCQKNTSQMSPNGLGTGNCAGVSAGKDTNNVYWMTCPNTHPKIVSGGALCSGSSDLKESRPDNNLTNNFSGSNREGWVSRCRGDSTNVDTMSIVCMK